MLSNNISEQYDRIKKRRSSLFTNTMQFEKHGFSSTNFECRGAVHGEFLREQAFEAIEIHLRYVHVNNKSNLNETISNLLNKSSNNQIFFRKWHYSGDHGRKDFLAYCQNTLKILLGLALVHGDQTYYQIVVDHLGQQGIRPFSAINFMQCKIDFDPQARELLELTLKACLVVGDLKMTEKILIFARDNRYLLAIDEQTVWYLIRQTQKGREFDGNYQMLQLLVKFEIFYKIKVNEHNRVHIISLKNENSYSNMKQLYAQSKNSGNLENNAGKGSVYSPMQMKQVNKKLLRHTSTDSLMNQLDMMANREKQQQKEPIETVKELPERIIQFIESDDSEQAYNNQQPFDPQLIGSRPQQEVYTKYLQPSDFIEQYLGFENANKHLPNRLTILIYSLIDSINYDTVNHQLLQFNLYDRFVDLEKLCSKHNRFIERQNLVISMFLMAIKHNYDSIALHMANHYESCLLRSTQQVVSNILNAMQKDLTTIGEIRLSLLQRLQPNFHFRHADQFLQMLDIVKSDAFRSDGMIVRSSNPIMWLVLIVDILTKLSKQFRSLTLRINIINDQIQEKFVKIYENFYDTEKIEIQLTQKDLQGVTVVQYLAQLKMHRLLQINHVNRIVNSMWQSKTDFGGSMFDLATSYDLTVTNQLKFQEDNELRKRFYRRRVGQEKPMPHRFNIQVWKKSMSLRYLIETIIFFALMAFFQYEVSLFNKDLHISIDEYLRFKELEHEIVERGGLTYRESHAQNGNKFYLVEETEHHANRILARGGINHKDVKEMTLEEMQFEEEVLHMDMVYEFGLVADELTIIIDLSGVFFIFPLQLLCKYVGSKFNDRRFFLTFADYLDTAVFLMVAWLWEVIEVYMHSDIREELFGPEEDSQPEIKFVDNLIYDITKDIFYLDYLMAFITAILWFRSNMMLRLTKTFGPLLVMIYRMAQLVVIFLLIYLLGLLTFACVATLTLTENQNFENLFEAMRTYLEASLGEFDLHQYDEAAGWKKYFGIGMHISVIFFNMILMINLLIAIMSDQYALMQEVRLGLYWGQVINEMPKLQYDNFYGALNIFPFFFGWLSFLLLPFFMLIKNRTILRTINEVSCIMVYFPFSLVLLICFMIVNAVLIHIAYFKTIIHKIMLLKSYKSSNHCLNVLIFTVFGIPFLVLAQFTDVFRFMRHTYDGNQRQQIDRHYKLNISVSEFNKLLHNVNSMIEKGNSEMNAVEFVTKLRDQHRVLQNISGYLFGVQNITRAFRNSIKQEKATTNDSDENETNLIKLAEKSRQKNMLKVKTFNMVKNAVWSCVMNNHSEGIKKAYQKVNLLLLRDLMLEIKVLIDYHLLVHQQNLKAYTVRNSRQNSASNQDMNLKNYPLVDHVLMRFSSLASSELKETIKQCEKQGEILN